MNPESLLLLPAPRVFTRFDGTCQLADRCLILLDNTRLTALRASAARFQKALLQCTGLNWEMTTSQFAPAGRPGLVLEVRPERVVQPQGYRLTIGTDGIRIAGYDEAGLFYGVCTLIQLVEINGAALPALEIIDWPDFKARGVLLDISRDKVPTMETLYNLIDLLAGWKINQFQLYTEHTYAYQSHPRVWANASPLTSQDILDLDAYCRERYIELAPNQNSFGHFSRWLMYPEYEPLAEVTGGYEMPWGRQEGSFSLCPIDPSSLDLLSGLYDELLPNFTSRIFNVGCDETYDVGQGRSRAQCQQLGNGRVYLNFLLEIYKLVKQHGFTMQFWGDIIIHYPEFISELPKDMIALEWGYEAGHPFEERCARFAQAGIPFYVCPGTSSWRSLSGRTENALANLKSASGSGLKYGASGYLITDWGDNGHWQPLPVSYLGFAAGAAYAWALSANEQLDIRQALDAFAFQDPAGRMGRVVYELGDIHRACGLQQPNSSLLFDVLQTSCEDIRQYASGNADGFHQALALIETILPHLEEALMRRIDASLILREFHLVGRMLGHASQRGIAALEEDPAERWAACQELGADLEGLLAEYRQVWLARNRPGGLEDSLAWFDNNRAA